MRAGGIRLEARQIQMHPEAVRSVSFQALHSLKADRPSEIGGLLWGKQSHNAMARPRL
jgi:hypothetical protein